MMGNLSKNDAAHRGPIIWPILKVTILTPWLNAAKHETMFAYGSETKSFSVNYLDSFY